MTMDHANGRAPRTQTTTTPCEVRDTRTRHRGGVTIRRRSGTAACITILALAAALPAATLAAGDPNACREIVDPDERLRCYDRALGVDSPSGSVGDATAERGEREEPTTSRTAPPAKRDAAVGSATDTPASTSVPPATRAGMEAPGRSPATPGRNTATGKNSARNTATRDTGPEPQAADDPDATDRNANAASRIAEIRRTSLGRERFHLSNGEVWERTRLDTPSNLAEGDVVVVGESLFGSRFLRARDGSTQAVKVRRLD